MELKMKMQADTKIDADKLYTFKEIADLFGVAYNTVYQYVHKGELPIAVNTLKNKQIRGADVIAFLQERGSKRQRKRKKIKTSNKPDELVCRGCRYSVPGGGYGGHVCNYCFETGKKRGVAKEDCYKQVNTPYTPDLCL